MGLGFCVTDAGDAWFGSLALKSGIGKREGGWTQYELTRCTQGHGDLVSVRVTHTHTQFHDSSRTLLPSGSGSVSTSSVPDPNHRFLAL